MRKTGLGIAAALLLASSGLALAQEGWNSVNGYTKAQQTRAEARARSAGYTPTRLAYVQSGNIFLWATKGGVEYILTVTPEGKVHAGGVAVKATAK